MFEKLTYVALKRYRQFNLQPNVATEVEDLRCS